jgi:diguanylate cyclase (GGDEF)-like protein
MKFWNLGQPTLQHRLALGMGAMLLPLIALVAGAFIAFSGAIRSFEKNGNETLEILFPIASLETSLQAARTLSQKCLEEQSDSACQQYQKSNLAIREQFQTMLKTPTTLNEQQVFLVTSQRSWEAANSEFERLQDSDNRPTALALDELEAEQQAALMGLSQLYRLVTSLQLQDDIKQAENLKLRVQIMTGLGFGLGLGVALTAGWWLARSILKPLNALEQGVQHLGDGKLSYRIKLSSQDEFGKLAETFNLMAAKLEQSQQELIDLATLDGLTGVFNRREFNRRFKNELERAQRYHHNCCLIMFDIDHFKKLNDTYGHPAGDEALKHFANLLKTQVRPADVVARYGGEEFGVILPETEIAKAVEVAERLRKLIETQTVAISTEQTIHITSSIGISVFPQDASETYSLLEAADQALYAAKRSGRNRVIRYCDLNLQAV